MQLPWHIIRYFSLFIISCIVTFMMFILMQKMLSFDQQTKNTNPIFKGLDFVRLIREPQRIKKNKLTPTPDKPKPPERKKPPPKIEQIPISKPRIDRLMLPSPRLQTKLNLNDALYLGDFQKNQQISSSVKIDEEVVPLVRIAPRYPSRAARLGIEGWVKMEVLINSQGAVEEVKVIESRPNKMFNRAAVKAIKRWRFRPKIIQGTAVPRIAEQKIEFKLQQ